MKAFLSFLAAAFVILPYSYGDSVASWSSYFNRQRFDFNITEEQLNDTPSWQENADNPPLSARKAIQVAQAFLPKMIAKSEQWTLHKLSLEKMGDKDKWVYVVQFEGPHPGGDGFVSTMDIVVLMSGVPVKPKVSEWELK